MVGSKIQNLKSKIQNPLWVVLAVYLLLALGYGVVNPLFEAPDEHWHYFTAQYIADTGRLPAVAAEPDPFIMQEAAQPPLYYVIGALLIGGVDTAGAREELWPNSRVWLGDASSPTNKNAFVHGPQEAWPWHGYVLAAHLLRILSAVYGLGTLLFLYHGTRLTWPERPGLALWAVSLVAFLPQFTFVHGTISNDTLITLLSAAALWQLLRLWRSGVTEARLLLLGLTIGLAILAKTAGLLLPVYAAAVVAWLTWREAGTAGWRTFAGRAALLVVPALALSGWLLWRNWNLYGDVTAANQFVRIADGDRNYTLWQVMAETPGLWTSLFAIFGWFNVRAPQWVYAVWNGMAVLAVAGVLLFWRGRGSLYERGDKVTRRQGDKVTSPHLHTPTPLQSFTPSPPLPLSKRPEVAAPLLLLWLLLIYAGLVQFLLKTPGAQGRLLFPALLPLATGLVYGLSRWRWRWLPPVTAGLALLTSLYGLFVLIPRAYARPPLVAEADIPATATRYHTDLGEGLELVAAELHTPAAYPGDWVLATLYWRAERRPVYSRYQDVPYFVLELYGRELEPVGKLQSYHGGGLYPPSFWPPGQVVVDRVAVQLTETLALPTQITVFAKLAGAEPSQNVGALKVVPETWPAASEAVLASIGDAVQLAAATVNQTTAWPEDIITLTVRWQVQAPPGRDWTTFVHLGDPAQPPLATADSVPLAGDYPTRYWAAGEVFDDQYTLVVPTDMASGRYPLLLGMYDSESITRLPLLVNGERQFNDAYIVEWIAVEER
ncbi:MAG: DUF2142 domain-containing protein [Chloroflexi bacterium]|nr:DUF2142 domain-containing protein [Chloroflexota bacterium]MCI0648672.1 DUF2142 domain-containing protein [Chloroflexota bacterium]MCI0728080.1 DUF2142 domain-containing protein [Chloroflexota bacterium]